MLKRKFVILEIIPTKICNGEIAQLSALKIEDLKLVDRFDYRLNKKLITNDQLLAMVNYDNEQFTYCDKTSDIIKEFKKFIGNDVLLIMDNFYTLNYLCDIKNKKESVFKYLNMEYADDIIFNIEKKYNIVPTNHIVDILYEALLFENGDDNGNS